MPTFCLKSPTNPRKQKAKLMSTRRASTLTLLTKLAERGVQFRARLTDGTVIDTLTSDKVEPPIPAVHKNEWDEVLGNGHAAN